MRRAWLVVPLICACSSGDCNAVGDGIGQLFLIVVGVLVALSIAAAGAYLLFWVLLVRSLRAASAGDAATAVRSWLWALMATLVHGAGVWLTSEWGFGDGPVASVLVLAAAVPLSALVAIAVLAARRGARWPLVPSLGLVAFTAHVAIDNGSARPLDELPGRIVQLAGDMHMCARLSTGQVACIGPGWWGARGDGREFASEEPTLVRGLDDATEIQGGHGITCALRSQHAPVCWGGVDDLATPTDHRFPWVLPGADDAVALAVAERQIVWQRRDGTLGGWPEPPPAGLTRARLLASDDDIGGAWLCAVDEAGALACWPETKHDPREIQRFDAPPAVAVAVDAATRRVCVADVAGTVRCFDLQGGHARQEFAVPGLQQLVAVRLGGSFCARDDRHITCMRPDQPARVRTELGTVDAMFADAGMVCGVAGDDRVCVSLTQHSPEGATIIDFDRQP